MVLHKHFSNICIFFQHFCSYHYFLTWEKIPYGCGREYDCVSLYQLFDVFG